MFAEKIYLKPGTLWDQDGARFAVFAMDKTNEPTVKDWIDMTAVKGETGIYEATIDLTKHKYVLFGRMNPAKTENNFEDGTMWNQTKDLMLVDGSDLFTIKNKIESGDDNGKYDGEWSKFAASGSGETPKGFYVTGDEAFVVAAGQDKAKAWKADAIKSEKDTLELALKAGSFKMKVTLKGAWEPAADVKGYSNLTEKAKGLTAGSEDNICFTLKADGKVQVIFSDKVFKLVGAFDESQAVTIADGFYLIGLAGWELANINPTHQLKKAVEASDEYQVEATLAAGQSMKVVKIEGGAITKWYPDGMDNEYKVDAKHAGNVTIFFKETEQADWKDFGGYFYVTEPGEPTPDPAFVGVYYITGDEALVGAEKAWKPDAIKSEKDTFALDLKAGDYQLKITLDGKWETAKGFSDLTKKAAGLSANSDGNICFTLKEAGKVKVVYDGINFELLGAFDESKTPELEDGFYLIGQTGWDMSSINAALKFEPNEDTTEYMLHVTLVAEQKLKVVKVEKGAITTWYPDGMGTDYVVDAAHAGTVNIYFKDKAQEDEAWKAFGGFMFISEPGEPTPDPEFKGVYYITGNDALVGADKAWNPEAIKAEKDTFVLNLKAGDFELKITLDGKWETAKGYGDLTEKAKGLYTDQNSNICFTLKEDGEVKVIYNGKIFKLEGKFDEAKEQTLEDGFYLIGQKGWNEAALNASLKFAANGDNAGEYKLEVELTEGQPLKVVKVEGNAIKAWYPEGEGNEYKVDAAHAGKATIYFKETAQEDWKDFGGFIYVEVNNQAIDNTAVETKAIKFFENGQLIIMKNGVRYNANGQMVK